MKKYILMIIMIVVLSPLVLFALENSEKKEEYTKEELDWIKTHNKIYLAPDPDFAPVEFIDEEGNYSGIASDFLKWISQDTGLEFEIVRYETWSEILDSIKLKKVDMLGAARKTQERMKYLIFTEEYFDVPTVLFVRKDSNLPKNINEIENLNIGLIKGYAVDDFMGIQYPEIKVIKVNNIEEGLRKLSETKEIDGFLSDIAQGTYYIDKFQLKNIVVSFDIDFNYEFGFAIRDDYVLLRSILDKALKRMPEIKKREIKTRWTYIQEDRNYLNKKILYGISGIAIVFFILITIVGIINRALKRQVEYQTKELKRLNEDLEIKVKKRTVELELTNQKLEESINVLKMTQNELIEVQKLVALGQLVKGVAHEINTPLGISITISTYIEDTFEPIKKKIKDNKISKRELFEWINSFEDSMQMLNYNLKRITNIVNDFKLIAVEEYDNSKIKFNMKKNIDMIVWSLDKKYIQGKCDILIDCPDDLEIESYPESFSQIFANLIINSSIHGFKEEKGLIRIDIQKYDKYIMIFYEDNGIGITQDQKTKVFEPFYTTNRSNGGSGLGLFIVHTIVTKKLNGSINIDSKKGFGLSFFIKINI